MKNIPIYQVDSFASRLFKGNPAAVCVLDEWLPEVVMQAIAAENNLAETAFVVREGSDYSIRWFTPSVEVDLCGHATLAAAHVLLNEMGIDRTKLMFASRQRGVLSVAKDADRLVLDFPSDNITRISTPDVLVKALGVEPLETYKGTTDIMAVLPSEKYVAALKPNISLLATMDARGIIVTAEGETADFVSRFFGPQSGIDEDPVTGSAHTTMIPYWATELKKTRLFARQLSSRGGELWCEHKGDRVSISGHAVTYMSGTLKLN
jgi:PhzF family phenazine biosynthesis protein